MGETCCCCLLPTPGSIARRRPGQSYFTDYTVQKALFYAVVLVYVASTTLVAFAQPFIPLPCTDDDGADNVIEKRELNSGDSGAAGGKYANPDYANSLCDRTRFPRLLFMTVHECDFSRRVVAAVILGGIIGWERRQADRPAGIRTMSLVSLGSCLFTICSTFAFVSGPNTWDASRISAAIPSGVGFLGAGLIFKQADTDNSGEPTHVVHGLTTAASLWLSAAVGIACGGELYFAAAFSTAVLLVMLRFGPRNRQDMIDREEEEEEDHARAEQGDVMSSPKKEYMSTATAMTPNAELKRLVKADNLSVRSIRSKPQLV